MRNRQRLFSILLIVIFILIWQFGDNNDFEEKVIEGTTMGTTYQVKIISNNEAELKEKIDSLLTDLNLSLSTYIDSSEISRFNRRSSLEISPDYFIPVFQASADIYEETEGAFDPTVMPVVNAWGFGPAGRMDLPDSSVVDSLLQVIGLEKLSLRNNVLIKEDPRIQLDFSAIAKGYGVDLLSEFLDSKGAENYMVEIGGEVRCKGVNMDGEIWRLGIEDPTEESTLSAIVGLDNRAMATSGNYRNYYIKDGRKYAHMINPKTGYPVIHSILSATVLAEECMIADGLATAFMVMGEQKAIDWLSTRPEIDAVLIYSDQNGELRVFTTPGIENIKLVE